MPTLKLNIEMPDYLYQQVLALPPDERDRAIVAALRLAALAPPPVKTPLIDSLVSSLNSPEGGNDRRPAGANHR